MAQTHLTEAERLSTCNAELLLHALEYGASVRKLRLLVVAAMRRIWGRFTEWEQVALQTLERFADGTATLAEMERCRSRLSDPRSEYWGVFDQVVGLMVDLERAPTANGRYAICSVIDSAIYVPGHRSTYGGADLAERARSQQANRRAVELVWEVFGNFYQPVAIDAAWLHWNSGTVPALSQTIYDERRFDHLPILADALEEAGCCNEQVLLHCRSGGEHCRGCWLIDLLLERR